MPSRLVSTLKKPFLIGCWPRRRPISRRRDGHWNTFQLSELANRCPGRVRVASRVGNVFFFFPPSPQKKTNNFRFASRARCVTPFWTFDSWKRLAIVSFLFRFKAVVPYWIYGRTRFSSRWRFCIKKSEKPTRKRALRRSNVPFFCA